MDNILVDGRRHPDILNARYITGADCDTDHFFWLLQKLGKDC